MGTVQARVAHRERHKTTEKISLEQRLKQNEREAEAIVRQFMEIGEVHRLESLDPIEDAPIPYIVYAEDAEARRFKIAAWCAGGLGVGIAAGLSILTIVGDALRVFLIGFGLAILIAGVLVGILLTTTSVHAKNPGARRALNRWGAFFGALTAVSLTAFLWFRFVADLQLLQQVGVPIVGFEVGVLGLTAVFHSLHVLYIWSRELTEAYNHLMEQRIVLEPEEAVATTELTRLSDVRLSADAEERIQK